ncbi:MAG: PrgI family protein [Patescibacteria group bacterium]
MQFKVPQDVLRPDKIVGFLTLRQLIIVMIGGGICYSLYIVLSKQYFVEIWLPPVVFIGVITAAFAFFKFHDIVFEKLILVFIEYKFRPRARTWQKMQGDIVLSVLSNPLGRNQNTAKKVEPLSARDRRLKMEEITRMVDTHGKDLLSKKSPAQTPKI